MRVGIIGAGNIGANLARQWSSRGHDILLSYKRDAKHLEVLASELGTRWGAPEDAAALGEALVLATPWSVLDDLADRVRLAGTIVIDATNPFIAGGLAQLPAGKSAGAVNAQRFAGSRLVKAFNTYTARFQEAIGNGETGHPVAMFLSGEDADGKQITQVLVRDAGFEPVDLGGLRQMPLMEAPRREGAVYGEAYSPDAARRVARAASTDLAEAARLATLLREP